MKIQPRGPEGIQQRMEEIRRRMDEKLGRAPSAEMPAVSPETLKGAIGGFKPYDPFSAGTQIAPGALPGMIETAAKNAGVDPMLFDALIQTESAYDPNARSRAGALGLSQLMPETARGLGVNNPFDPIENLKGGAAYLSQMLQRFGGDAKLALAAYNAGPGAVERYGGIPPYAETQKYVDRVLGLFEARKNR